MVEKAVFIRRGLDSGIDAGRAHGVFNKNLNFDYFPVIFASNVSKENFFISPTYSNIGCRLGGYMSEYLPERLKDAIPYTNPNFDNLTFEERAIPTYKKLAKLKKGDLIIFYESLKLFKNWETFDPNSLDANALFIIGFFIIDRDPIITLANSLPDSNDLSYLKRRFRGHPFLYINDPTEWDNLLYEQERIFISGDQTISGLYDFALEISDSTLRKNNYQPINEFFKERWGIGKSIMRTGLVFAEKPEIVMKDLTSWLNDAKKTSKDFVKAGWKPKYGFIPF
ncbi:MAG: hypothetical protein ACTSP3_02025 [Candidatus Heimdallarchaeaceae archaeon]